MEQMPRHWSPIRNQNDVIVRHACSSDMFLIESIINEQAAARGVPEHERPTVKHLMADTFECQHPWCRILVAESSGEVVGLVTYYHRYWSWSGRTIYLSGLYVRPTARRRGVGKKLFLEICGVALAENAQLDWEQPINDIAATEFIAQFKPSKIQVFEGHSMLRTHLHVIQTIAKGIAGGGASRSSYVAEKEDINASKMNPNQELDANKIVTVRHATPEDMVAIKTMIQELAELQEHPDGPQLTENDLVKDGFNSSHPWFFALIAERDRAVVGMVMGNRVWKYQKRSFYLQGLFVRSNARRCGVAEKLVKDFCRVAVEEDVDHIDLHVSYCNAPALALYSRLQAVEVPDHDSILSFRLTLDNIREICTANSLS